MLPPSVLGQDRSETKKIGLGLVRCGLGLAHSGLGFAGLMSCCEIWSCYARRHNDPIYSFSILCLEHR